ncbi:MAG: hypothetical protein ACP5MH_04600 [Thermoproteus sp.]
MRTYAFVALLFAAALLGTLPYLAAPSQASEQVLPAAPYSSSNTAPAAAYNTTLFVSLAVVATVFIYLIMRYKKFFKIFIAAIWFLVILGVFWAYDLKYYACGLLPDAAAEALFYAPFAVAPAMIYAILKARLDPAIAVFSAFAGTMVVWILPPLTVLALLVILPVYDLVMVYWGLLGKIVKKAKEGALRGPGPEAPREPPLLGLMAKVGEVSVGTGDFFAYAAALTFIGIKFSRYGLLPSLAAIALGVVLIYTGFLLTVRLLLRRFGYAPALPIPLALVMPLLLL